MREKNGDERKDARPEEQRKRGKRRVKVRESEPIKKEKKGKEERRRTEEGSERNRTRRIEEEGGVKERETKENG